MITVVQVNTQILSCRVCLVWRTEQFPLAPQDLQRTSTMFTCGLSVTGLTGYIALVQLFRIKNLHIIKPNSYLCYNQCNLSPEHRPLSN